MLQYQIKKRTEQSCLVTFLTTKASVCVKSVQQTDKQEQANKKIRLIYKKDSAQRRKEKKHLIILNIVGVVNGRNGISSTRRLQHIAFCARHNKSAFLCIISTYTLCEHSSFYTHYICVSGH